MKKIAAMADAAYVVVAPHNPNGPVCTAASMHIAASIPNFVIMEEGNTATEQYNAAVARQAGTPDKQIREENGCALTPPQHTGRLGKLVPETDAFAAVIVTRPAPVTEIPANLGAAKRTRAFPTTTASAVYNVSALRSPAASRMSASCTTV